MNRDECHHEFSTVPEWGNEQAIPCNHNCGVRAIIRLDGKTTANLEADLREQLAGEIEAAGRTEVAWLADTAADSPGTVEMGRLIGTEDGYKAAIRIVRGASADTDPAQEDETLTWEFTVLASHHLEPGDIIRMTGPKSYTVARPSDEFDLAPDNTTERT